MPVSLARHIPTHVDVMLRLRPARILDLGAGFGLYGAIAREYLDVFCAPVPYGTHATLIDCVEVYEPYVTGLHRAVYDGVAIEDGLAYLKRMPDDAYDLILLLDVLEHFTRSKGEKLLREARRVSTHTLVNVPYPPGPQGEVFGNEHEAHVSAWEPDDFAPCEVIEQTDALICLL